MPGSEDYIHFLGAPPLLIGAMARLRSPSLFAVNHPAMTYGHVGCAGFGGSGICRRRNREVPGCLKSESEERETWTAESLRTASPNEEGLTVKGSGFFAKRAVMEETWRSTFKVHRTGRVIGRSGGPRQNV